MILKCKHLTHIQGLVLNINSTHSLCHNLKILLYTSRTSTLTKSKMTHNERVCHEAGERRQNYLNQIKCILEKMDDTPCVVNPGGTVGQESFEKPLIEYPGYINRLNPKFNKPFYEPLIPNVTAERRLYCGPEGQDLTKTELPEVCRGILTPEEFRDGSGRKMPPTHSTRSKPAELKMGYMIQGCDCRKHNGLQDQCERSECGGRPSCLTQPDPSCGPSDAYNSPPPQRTREEVVEEALASWPRPKLQYCCCTTDCGSGVPTYGKQDTGTGHQYACYPCSNN